MMNYSNNTNEILVNSSAMDIFALRGKRYFGWPNQRPNLGGPGGSLGICGGVPPHSKKARNQTGFSETQGVETTGWIHPHDCRVDDDPRER
ncbi:MAG: hypothetical protein ACFB12_17785 [Leptolyngbyaceae cyanobacterium]